MCCTDGTEAIVLLMFSPLIVFFLYLILIVNNTELEPDLEMAPEYAAVQHDTPPPYLEIDSNSLGVALVEIDDDVDYDGMWK
jgi:hypothetical protein